MERQRLMALMDVVIQTERQAQTADGGNSVWKYDVTITYISLKCRYRMTIIICAWIGEAVPIVLIIKLIDIWPQWLRGTSCRCVNSQKPGAVFLHQEVGQLLKDWLAVQGDKLFPTDLTGGGRGRDKSTLCYPGPKHFTDMLPRLCCWPGKIWKAKEWANGSSPRE